MDHGNAPAAGQQSDDWLKEAERLIRDYGQACFLSRSHAEMNAARDAIVRHIASRATLPAAAACAEQGEAVAWRFRHRHLGPDAPWRLCDHEPDVPGLEVHPLFVDAAPKELLEAVDSVLETAPCECSHKQRYEIGGHKSYCFLFDLDIARNKCGASLPPPARNGEMSDERKALQAALEALEYMHSEKCDYMIRNKLGNPAHETATKLAVGAMTAARAVLSASCAPKQTEGDGNA